MAFRYCNICYLFLFFFTERLSISDKGVVCTTEESFEGNKAQVIMSFDGAIRSFADMYEYRANPAISSVTPFEAFKA